MHAKKSRLRKLKMTQVLGERESERERDKVRLGKVRLVR